mgnify:CR=1 FL=1
MNTPELNSAAFNAATRALRNEGQAVQSDDMEVYENLIELTPAERIDLKADMELTSQLAGFCISERDMVNYRLSSHEQENIEMALRRYPVLVELVRRLSAHFSGEEPDFG